MGSIKQLHAIELNAIRNLGRAAGLLYILIDILAWFSVGMGVW